MISPALAGRQSLAGASVAAAPDHAAPTSSWRGGRVAGGDRAVTWTVLTLVAIALVLLA